MAFDFSAGLSEAGKSVAVTAGAGALEFQKGELEKEKVKLADELAGVRDEKQRGFLTSERVATQGFTGAENEKNRGSQKEIAQLQTAAHLGAAAISAGASRYATDKRTEVEREALTPAEVRTAQWFAKASPAEKEAFQSALLTKAGMPAWAVGGGASIGSTIPVQATVDGKPADLTNPGSAAAPPVSPVAPKDAKATPAGFNEDALQGMPAEAVAQVKAMVDGRTAPPSSFAAAKPYWQALIAAANKYDPTFDQTTWASRNATRKDFTAGKSSQAVTALNTALGHAGVVADSLEKLDNRGGLLTPLNSLLNGVGRATGDERQTNAQMGISALASEARKVFAASGGGSLTELENWEKNFPINGSPDQQKGALKQFVNLLDSRLVSLADQYNRGMSRTDDPMQLLEPHARKVFTDLMGRKPENATGRQMGTSGPGAGEGSATLPPEDKRAIGRTYQTPTGPYIWMGNGWAKPPTQEVP